MYINICVSIEMQNQSIPSSVCIASPCFVSSLHMLSPRTTCENIEVDELDVHESVDEKKYNCWVF